jgi:hypothetical protein
LTIRSLAKDISKKIETEGDNLDMQLFTKQVYREAKQWLQEQSKSESSDNETMPWIILDDVSALGALVGERLAYGLVLSLNALAVKLIQFRIQIWIKLSKTHGHGRSKELIYRQPTGGCGRTGPSIQ